MNLTDLPISDLCLKNASKCWLNNKIPKHFCCCNFSKQDLRTFIPTELSFTVGGYELNLEQAKQVRDWLDKAVKIVEETPYF